jgi:hypothetical protein
MMMMVMELLPQLQIALRDLPSKLDATAAVAVRVLVLIALRDLPSELNDDDDDDDVDDDDNDSRFL